jgi:C-terminal processing protease CtpA/Prc
VFDMRYLQGGSGDIAIVETIRDDKRVNRPGGLTVLIGRENFSAATSVAEFFDRETSAVFVGEPTPARADNFRCDCHDFTLPHSGFQLSVPTWYDRFNDDRPEITPDVPMALSSADFFAGRDPVLEAALAGAASTP